jgi:hypothetical protein
MSYASSSEVWKHLGKDAYTKIRSEIVGTGSDWNETDHDNLISNSIALYTGGVLVTTPNNYISDLDDGTLSLSGLTAAGTITIDYDYADLPDSIIQQMISSSDSLIDTETGRTFGSSSGTEYLNKEASQKVFFLKHYPVIALTSVERNLSVQTTVPDWETLSAGLGEDYIANSEDLELGRIRWIDNFPYDGEDMIKVTYSYGYASTPSLVKELSILLTIKQMANSSVYKSIFKGYDNFTPVRLDEINNRIEELKRILKKQSIALI